jgi:hypothetical protein
MIAGLLLCGILAALWLNADPIFLAYRIFTLDQQIERWLSNAFPQAFNWMLMFGLAVVLALNFLHSVNQPAERS